MKVASHRMQSRFSHTDVLGALLLASQLLPLALSSWGRVATARHLGVMILVVDGWGPIHETQLFFRA